MFSVFLCVYSIWCLCILILRLRSGRVFAWCLHVCAYRHTVTTQTCKHHTNIRPLYADAELIYTGTRYYTHI